MPLSLRGRRAFRHPNRPDPSPGAEFWFLLVVLVIGSAIALGVWIAQGMHWYRCTNRKVSI